MLAFIILSFSLLLGALIKPSKQSAFLVLSFIVLFVLMAYKDLSVGTDTLTYEYLFRIYHFGGEQLSGEIEPLWGALNEIIIKFGGNFRYLLIVSSLAILLPIFIVAKKYSMNPMLTVFLYYSLYFYLYAFNITRQAVAVSICLLALNWLVREKKFLYLIAILIASQFHLSAYIMLPVLFVDKIPTKNYFIILSLIVSIIIGLFGLSLIFSLIEHIGYATYAIKSQPGSFFNKFMGVLLYDSLFLYILFSINKRETQFKLFYLFIILFNLIASIPFSDRLLMYLAIYQVLFFPYYLKSLKIH